ncbi:beta-galactosidase-1-like protein 3 [Zophobas morio]|uniref:beta-galactosidase-1-like protein 3 n=1 Tax=Zophobas morio TaxID=2755281 RepID=UPI003082E2A0
MALSAPTLYEYYTSGGITSGLSTNQPYFTLNDKNVTLYSGALHYFRVPRQYWRDRLRKLKAAGLNTVETYVPWNLHEPEIGTFDFGNGGSDMEDFLHVEEFVKMAQEEDLLVIVRPGPYICAEWEFGGLPSWLLREKDIKVRTSDDNFMKHVSRYFGVLLPILAALQFTNGGAIVGFQVENEYGSTEWKKDNESFVPDKVYLEQLRTLMVRNGIKELLFTSDNPSQHGDVGTLHDIFQTANFARNPKKEFDSLKKLQANKPTMAMEYWTGWFDHWSENHSKRDNVEFRQVLNDILRYPASFNMYMFHGGTNWGFLNGANLQNGKYQPDTTSYDYDAPLTENGDYTEKYHIVKNLIAKYNKVITKVPPPPKETPRIRYPDIEIKQQLQFSTIVEQLPQVFQSTDVVPMELLPINNDSGQSYGYTIYRTTADIPPNSVLKMKGYVHDSVLVLVDGKLVSRALRNSDDINKFGYWRLKDGTLTLPEGKNSTIDLIVENWGRNNFGKLEDFKQFKGLTSDVFLNTHVLKNWEIRPLEFKTKWTKSLHGWYDFSTTNLTLNKANLEVDQPMDTYLDMSQWNTGIVTINGFVLGRYMHLGPQQTLYLPAPLLKPGTNEIIIFEHFTPATHVKFSQNPIYLKK